MFVCSDKKWGHGEKREPRVIINEQGSHSQPRPEAPDY